MYINTFKGGPFYVSLLDALDDVRRLPHDPTKFKSSNAKLFANYPVWCQLTDGTFVPAPTDDDELVMTMLMMSR